MANSSNKWMPTAGGIISIIAGALGFIGSVICAVIAIIINNWYQIDPYGYFDDPDVVPIVVSILWISAAITLALSIVPIIGGVFALQRKSWGWALAGAICAALSSNVIGVIAIVFIAMSKQEFIDKNNITEAESGAAFS